MMPAYPNGSNIAFFYDRMPTTLGATKSLDTPTWNSIYRTHQL